jgi:hypothetical protein
MKEDQDYDVSNITYPEDQLWLCLMHELCLLLRTICFFLIVSFTIDEPSGTLTKCFRSKLTDNLKREVLMLLPGGILGIIYWSLFSNV